jgi:hypothetical protein
MSDVTTTRESGVATRRSGSKAAHEAVTQAEDVPTGMPRLTYRIKEAAAALGMSVDSFERYVEAEIKVLRLGSMKLVPPSELERFIEENAYRVGGDW